MPTTLKVIADIATSSGLILGVPLALYGIDAWRREAMWKRRSELCEEVLALCYEVKEIISYIRSPGGFEGYVQSILRLFLELPSLRSMERKKNA